MGSLFSANEKATLLTELRRGSIFSVPLENVSRSQLEIGNKANQSTNYYPLQFPPCQPRTFKRSGLSFFNPHLGVKPPRVADLFYFFAIAVVVSIVKLSLQDRLKR